MSLFPKIFDKMRLNLWNIKINFYLIILFFSIYFSIGLLVYKDYGNVKGKYEDCEHRAFHQQARMNSGAKIRISADVLFN